MLNLAVTDIGWSESERIVSALQMGYGLHGVHVARLLIRQNTTNYRASTGSRELFVKNYPVGADLTAEVAAISLTRLAGEHRVPVAPVVPSRNDAVVHRFGSGHAISVWEWRPAHPVPGYLSRDQQVAAGHALGALHQTFRLHPAGGRRCDKAERWLAPDLAGIQSTIDRVMKAIGAREQRDEFAHIATTTLNERRAMLHTVPGLLAELPPLSCQVLHGDYSTANLLFTGDKLAAVVDFSPPEPFLLAYELGRIAFDPHAVTGDDDWIHAGLNLVRAYLDANPTAATADVLGCARVALLQLITSLYGVQQHYLAPGLLQADLDQFWIVRHHAAQQLARNLPTVEAALGAIIAQR
jgi:Ser/Thr protein kinase RdoA (MazF antagonist)